MAKKNWIKVKRGLIVDTKHRRQIGAAIWFFLYLLDKADWETGTVEHKHADAAHDMGVVRSTIQEWYETLKEHNYISAKSRGRHGLLLTIHNWTNPRQYSGDVLNKTTEVSVGSEDEISTDKSTDISTDIPYTDSGTSTLSSHTTDHKSLSRNGALLNRCKDAVTDIIYPQYEAGTKELSWARITEIAMRIYDDLPEGTTPETVAQKFVDWHAKGWWRKSRQHQYFTEEWPEFREWWANLKPIKPEVDTETVQRILERQRNAANQ